MSNERDKQSMDELVSATYRKHSTERAPDELNRKILAMAANDVSRSGRNSPLFGSWTRPLTLAATVALSFAVVLEITKLPDNESAPIPPTPPPVAASESLSKAFTPAKNGSVEEARNQARQREGFNRDESLVAEPQAVPELDARQDAALADSTTDVAKAEILQEVAPAAQTPSIAGETKVSDAERGCDAETRETAKDWLACIEALRRSGAVAAADREYEDYILQFPVE